jgi:hypothetical protein
MKNNRFLMLSMLITVALMTASCSKDSDDPVEEKDTTKPQITLNTPQNEANLNAGEAIEFSANFMDDKELSGYKIDIHFNDGHEHKSVNDEGKWSFQKSYTFEAGETSVDVMHNDVQIPTEVDGLPIYAGEYHFLVYCTDKAGNEEFVAHDIIIVELPDETGPTFSISLHPDTDQEYSRGDTIRLAGVVSDNKELGELLVAVMRSSSTNDMVNVTDAFAIVLNANEDVDGLNEYSFSSNIRVGAAQDNNVPPRDITWARGNFYVIVKALDKSGNVSFTEQYPIKLI